MKRGYTGHVWAHTMPVAALNTIKLLLLFLSMILLPAFAAEDGLKAFNDRKGDIFLVLEHRYFKQSLPGTTVQRLVNKCELIKSIGFDVHNSYSVTQVSVLYYPINIHPHVSLCVERLSSLMKKI